MTTPDPTTVPAHDWLYDAIEALISGAIQSVLTADAETALDTLKGATIVVVIAAGVTANFWWPR
jgi:uncharacterized protein HemX